MPFQQKGATPRPHCLLPTGLLHQMGNAHPWRPACMTNGVILCSKNVATTFSLQSVWDNTSYQRNGGGNFRPTRGSDNQTGYSILVHKYRRRSRRLGPFARLNHVWLGRFHSVSVLYTGSWKVVHFVVVDNARAIRSIFRAKAERN